jgi:hypothetical protein
VGFSAGAPLDSGAIPSSSAIGPLKCSSVRKFLPDIRFQDGKIKVPACGAAVSATVEAAPRGYTRRSETCSMAWSWPFRRMRWARGRVGAMFSRRLTRLIRD